MVIAAHFPAGVSEQATIIKTTRECRRLVRSGKVTFTQIILRNIKRINISIAN